MNVRLLVIAKEPVPGRVKTRLCPPCTPRQAALVARAALEDTLDTVNQAPASARTLVISGSYPAPPGWHVVPQRGDRLGERLAHAFVDAHDLVHTAAGGPPGASLLVGMDTPQLTVDLITDLAAGLQGADAVLGPARDGGWWGLALRDPRHAATLRDVPMSTPDTGRLTAAALRARGLRLVHGPDLRDVDTAVDAWAVAHDHPRGRFAAAVRAHVPAGERRNG